MLKKSIFFKTLDDEETPGFKFFLFVGCGFGFLAFLGASGTWNVWTGLLAFVLVVILGYILGLIVNFIGQSITRITQTKRRRG